MGLLGESRKLCCARLIYVDRVLFNKISFYENHKCPCVASAKCLCPKTEIYAFSFENTRLLTCCRSCIRIYTYSPNWKSVFWWNSLEKGSEIRRKTRCFCLCVMSNAFIFDGFLSMGEICFFVLISKTVEWF